MVVSADKTSKKRKNPSQQMGVPAAKDSSGSSESLSVLEQEASNHAKRLFALIGGKRLSSFVEKETTETLISGVVVTENGELDFSKTHERMKQLPEEWQPLMNKFLRQLSDKLASFEVTSVPGKAEPSALKPKIEVTEETRNTLTNAGLGKVIDTGVVENVKTRLLTKEGKQIETVISAAALQDPEGTITGIVMNLRDMTELNKIVDELQQAQAASEDLLKRLNEEKTKVEEKVKERTTELREEQRKLSDVTEHMKDGAILLDSRGQVLFFNRSMKEILQFRGANPKNILQEFFTKFSDEKTKNDLTNCLSNSQACEFQKVEIENKIYDIFLRDVQIGGTKNEEDAPDVLIFVRDVTEETLFERSKSELIAVASHQLRTPLTAIRGNIEMLVNENFGNLNKEQRELLLDVQISNIRLIGMVNDMLDITRIEKKNLDLEFEDFDLEEIIVSILSDLEDYKKQHNFTFDYQAPAESPRVYADRMRTRQVFQNIIDNAIKYNRYPGKLTISYKISEDEVQVRLKDNGIGIPENEKEKIFGRFYRASNTSALASSGSGLGLYIVKSIIEIMNGSIFFESEENKGTTFFVTLPTKKSDAPA